MTAAIDAPARARPGAHAASRRAIKALLPRGLFGRSVLLLAAPLILSQIVGTWVFYDRFWITVMRRQSPTAAASDIALILDGRQRLPADDERRMSSPSSSGTTGLHHEASAAGHQARRPGGVDPATASGAISRRR